MSTSGEQANGESWSPAIGHDRYVVFISEATNLVPNDTNGVADVFVRDRDTDNDSFLDEPGAVSTRRLNVSALGVQADAPAVDVKVVQPHVAFQTAATTLVPGLTPGVQRIFVARLDGPGVELASVSSTGQPADRDCDSFDIVNAGSATIRYVVVFRSDSITLVPGEAGSGGGVYARHSPEGRTVRLSPVLFPGPGGAQPRVASPSLDRGAANIGGDPGYVGFSIVNPGTPATGRLYRVLPDGTQLEDIGAGAAFDRKWNVVAVSSTPAAATYVRRNRFGRESEPLFTLAHPPVASDDGRDWLVRDGSPFLHDFLSGERTALPFAEIGGVAFTGHALVIDTTDATLVAGDTNGVRDVVAVDVRRLFDADGDLLDDRWERLTGLSPSDATGDNGAHGDPDGDGSIDLIEAFNTLTHPTGTSARYLAEGIVNGFFDTELHLANPSATTTAAVQIRYQMNPFSTLPQFLRIPPLQHRTVVPGVENLAGDFSMVVESNVPVVSNRRVTWDVASGYGAHLETSQASPATSWYLTEGSTVLGFELFYLLQNPGNDATFVTVRFLRPTGAPIVRTYYLGQRTRLTIHVNAVDPALAETDVSAYITAERPFIAERAMYSTRHGEVFALGTASAGVTAPATSWFLAEGATGTFFDLYVLIANPESADAAVTARFLKPDGSVVTRLYTIAANSRFSIFVDDIPGLEGTAVSTDIASTNGVPVVVERAMYWPGGFFDYYEGHAAAGVTAPARRWAIAHGEDGGPRLAQTYVLIANMSATAGQARVTLLPEGVPPGPPTLVPLPATSRVTLRVGEGGPSARFGVLVESIGDTPVPIVVEGASYWSVSGRIGSGRVGTPLP